MLLYLQRDQPFIVVCFWRANLCVRRSFVCVLKDNSEVRTWGTLSSRSSQQRLERRWWTDCVDLVPHGHWTRQVCPFLSPAHSVCSDNSWASLVPGWTRWTLPSHVKLICAVRSVRLCWQRKQINKVVKWPPTCVPRYINVTSHYTDAMIFVDTCLQNTS